MSIRELLPPPPPAPAPPVAGSGEGRVSSPVVAGSVLGSGVATAGASSEVTPTTPAACESSRGFGFDLSALLYGGGR